MSEAGHTERLEAALAGRYRIGRKLGEGGMASVYLAEDIKHKRNVALKILKPELAAVIGAERFLTEIQTTANLQHPHILALFDSGEAGGYLYYVMPYIDGETLREKLDREKQLGVQEAVRIARDVADALDYAHRAGVIHRDIKPGNILLHDGRPVVADFGVALAVSAAGGGRMTETGLSLGTPHYMSPEQASADRDLSGRSDVYSLGCVLYEMIGGQPPHTGPSAQSILVHILTKEATPLTELRHTVPPHVAATVAKAIEKLPADRFETAMQFRDALDDEGFDYRTRPQTTSEDSAATRSAASPPRRRAAVLPWAIAGVLGIVLAALWLRPVPRPLVQRFPLALGELGYGAGPAMAISPDGSTIAYVGQDQQLYWRPISSLEAQVVPGSQQSRSPFFSPDGRTIGYTVGPTSDDRIRTVSLDGTPPRTLSPDHFPGGTWGDDGFVYYVDLAGALWRVSEQGGEPEQLAEPSDGVRFRWPDALPRGRGLLVSTSTETIAIFDLESRETTPILAGSMARYAGRHIFWIDAEGTLFAAPFDPRSMELEAAGVQLAGGLQSSLQGSFDFAVSETGTLLYAIGEGGSATLDGLVWVGPEEEISVVDPRIGSELADVDNLALSPDGRFVAMEVAITPGAAEGEPAQIWIYDLEQSAVTRLTFEGTRNAQPRWMADGRTVAYLSNQGGGPTAIWSQPHDRTGTDQLVFQGEWDIAGFDVAPVDGLPIIVSAEGSLWLAEPGGESATPFLTRSLIDRRPRISPDGRWVAYESNESGIIEVYVRSFPDGGRPWPISRGSGAIPIWSPSGGEILYGHPERGIVAATVEFGAEVRVPSSTVLLSNTTPFELSAVGRPSASYEVSPDGERLLLIAGAGTGMTLRSAEETVLVLNVFEELRQRMGG